LHDLLELLRARRGVKPIIPMKKNSRQRSWWELALKIPRHSASRLSRHSKAPDQLWSEIEVGLTATAVWIWRVDMAIQALPSSMPNPLRQCCLHPALVSRFMV